MWGHNAAAFSRGLKVRAEKANVLKALEGTFLDLKIAAFTATLIRAEIFGRSQARCGLGEGGRCCRFGLGSKLWVGFRWQDI